MISASIMDVDIHSTVREKVILIWITLGLRYVLRWMCSSEDNIRERWRQQDNAMKRVQGVKLWQVCIANKRNQPRCHRTVHEVSIQWGRDSNEGEDLSTSRTEEGVTEGVVSLLALVTIGAIRLSRYICCCYWPFGRVGAGAGTGGWLSSSSSASRSSGWPNKFLTFFIS